VHDRLELLVPFPVTVGLFYHHAALDQQAFQHQVDIEFLYFGVADTQGDVLEITKDGEVQIFTVR
jgi:hypothetical protein